MISNHQARLQTYLLSSVKAACMLDFVGVTCAACHWQSLCSVVWCMYVGVWLFAGACRSSIKLLPTAGLELKISDDPLQDSVACMDNN
jgi:hypothetical protein